MQFLAQTLYKLIQTTCVPDKLLNFYWSSFFFSLFSVKICPRYATGSGLRNNNKKNSTTTQKKIQFNPLSTYKNVSHRDHKIQVITCCRICNCLTGDARWWFLKLVCCICGGCRRAGVAVCHIMWRIWWTIIILCILALAKTGIRGVFLQDKKAIE